MRVLQSGVDTLQSPGVLRGVLSAGYLSLIYLQQTLASTTRHLNWLKAFSSLNSKLLLAFLEKGFDYI